MDDPRMEDSSDDDGDSAEIPELVPAPAAINVFNPPQNESSASAPNTSGTTNDAPAPTTGTPRRRTGNTSKIRVSQAQQAHKRKDGEPTLDQNNFVTQDISTVIATLPNNGTEQPINVARDTSDVSSSENARSHITSGPHDGTSSNTSKHARNVRSKKKSKTGRRRVAVDSGSMPIDDTNTPQLDESRIAESPGEINETMVATKSRKSSKAPRKTSGRQSAADAMPRATSSAGPVGPTESRAKRSSRAKKKSSNRNAGPNDESNPANDGHAGNAPPESAVPTKQKRRDKKTKKKSSKKKRSHTDRVAPESSDRQDPASKGSRGHDRRRRKGQPIDGITMIVHRTDRLRLTKRLTNPIVKVILVDEDTGAPVSPLAGAVDVLRSSPNKCASHAYSIRRHQSLAPTWDFSCTLASDYAVATSPESNVIAFFEVCEPHPDSATPRDGTAAALSGTAWSGRGAHASVPEATGVAWAFMRLRHQNGNTNRVARLQLYEYSANVHAHSESTLARRGSLLTRLFRKSTTHRQSEFGLRNNSQNNHESDSDSDETMEATTDGGTAKSTTRQFLFANKADASAQMLLQELHGERVRYPSTIYVSVRPYPKVLTLLGLDTSASAKGAGTTGNTTTDADGDNTGNGGEAITGDHDCVLPFFDELMSQPPLWRRYAGQECRVPSAIQATLPIARGAMCMAFSANGCYLAVGACERDGFPIMILRIYDSGKAHVTAADLAPVTLDGHYKVVQDICWSADDTCVLSASSDCTARLWVVHQPHAPGRRTAPDDGAPDAAKSTTRRAAQRLENKLLPHPCHVYCARFVPDSSDGVGRHVATGAYDGVVRFWDVGPGRRKHGREDTLAQLLTELAVHDLHVNSLVFDKTGVKMFTADESGCICVWVRSTDATANAQTPRRSRAAWTHHQTVRDREMLGVGINRLHVHPSGRRVLVHGKDNVVRMLDLRTYTFMQHYHGTSTANSPVGSSISACGGFVLGGSDDGTALLWDADTGAVAHTFAHLGISGPVTAVAWHPLDNLAAFCSFGNGQPVVVCRAPPAPTSALRRGGPLPPLAATTGADTKFFRSPSPSLHDLTHSTVAGVPTPARETKVPGAVLSPDGEPWEGADPPVTSTMEDLQESRQRHVDKLLSNATAAITRRRLALEATSRIAVPIFTSLHPSAVPDAAARGVEVRMPVVGGTDRSSVASSLGTDASSGYKRHSTASGGRLHQEMNDELAAQLANMTPLHGSPLHEEHTRAASGNPIQTLADAAGSTDTYWAAFAYQAERPDELSFEAGTALHVVAQSGPSWWEAELDTGQRGLVPANFLTPIHPGTTPAPSAGVTAATETPKSRRRRSRKAATPVATTTPATEQAHVGASQPPPVDESMRSTATTPTQPPLASDTPTTSTPLATPNNRHSEISNSLRKARSQRRSRVRSLAEQPLD
eukprot:m.1339187 g.1339187  ORF g.1339187 m.1339187 type:complete len:1428 (-) comp24885_c1_seq6:89-4372(-)